MKVSVIIPARAGSKGIPGKNIMGFCGRPLLAWSILQAKAAQSVSNVYVTSDGKDILELAKESGATPIVRPADLCTDIATSASALSHALEVIVAKEGSLPDLAVFLQATSPLREASDIDGAVKVFMDQNADSLFSSGLLDDLCAWEENDEGLKGKTFDPFNRGRRQDRKPLFLENGSIYVFRPQLLLETGNYLGGHICQFDMPLWKAHEIDNPEDIVLCEFYFRRHLLPAWQVLPSPEKLDLIAYDFDGVMTDNRVHVMQDGTEAVSANRADGLGIGIIKRLGIPQMILSTEKNPVVCARAKKLGIEVIQGCNDKRTAFKEYCAERKIDLARTLFVGNDTNDLEVMRSVGYPVAPSDAHESVKGIACWLAQCKGGAGVIKELAERLDENRDE